LHANEDAPLSAYHRPVALSDAVAILASGAARVLAGGTDLYPATTAPDLSGPVVDVTGLPDLQGITQGADGLRIGACTTWGQIAAAPLPPALRALAQAAREVGGRQIQTAGTIGGNLCNASPAADGVPPLLACDALVELVGPTGSRRVALADFLTGPRRTLLRQAELLTAVIIPPASLAGESQFLKLGARAYLVISICMVAARVQVSSGRITGAALAVGAASPVARRMAQAEAALIGAEAITAADRITPDMLAAALSPLDDARASAAYRTHAACELLRRAVTDLTQGAA
jgi:CO/xanthine dehydrogenase FAD-binding subunit